MWVGDGGEGAKYWLQVLTEIKNRGAEDILMIVCDGLKHLPDSVSAVWPDTIVQTCVVHLMRNSFKYASRKDWDAISRALKPVYQAATADEAETRFLEFQEAWGAKYPAIVRLWENAWAEASAVPAIRPGDPQDRVHYERDRVGQRAHPQGREGSRPLPQRAGRAQMRLPRRDGAGPHRSGPGPVDAALERRPERVRHHLQRAPVRPQQLTQQQPSYTVNLTDPVGSGTPGG